MTDTIGFKFTCLLQDLGFALEYDIHETKTKQYIVFRYKDSSLRVAVMPYATFIMLAFYNDAKKEFQMPFFNAPYNVSAEKQAEIHAIVLKNLQNVIKSLIESYKAAGEPQFDVQKLLKYANKYFDGGDVQEKLIDFAHDKAYKQ